MDSSLISSLDTAAGLFSGVALGGAVLHRIATHRRAPSALAFLRHPLVFSVAGVFGMAATAWNTYRSWDSLKSKEDQGRLWLTRSVFLGGLLAFGNVGLGLIRSRLLQRFLARGLAFEDQTLRVMTGLQNSMVAAGSLTDIAAAMLAFSVDKNDGIGRKAEIFFQLGLTLFFGIDGHSIGFLKRSVRRPVEADFGKKIAQALAENPGHTAALSGSDPYTVGASLLDALGVPGSHSFRVANTLRGRPLDLSNEERACIRAKILSLFFPEELGSLRLDLLLEEIVRHSHGVSPVRIRDLERARRFVLSGQYQRRVIESFHASAVQVRQRVGSEIEFFLNAKVGRDELLRLFAEGPRRNGWEVSLLPTPPIVLGRGTKVLPGAVSEFTIGGHSFRIDNLQLSGGSLLSVWKGDQRLEVPVRQVLVSDPAETVLRAFHDNFESAFRAIAEDLHLPIQDLRNIAMDPSHIHYRECAFKDTNGNYVKWHYAPSEGTIHLDSAQLPDGITLLPDRYSGFDEAYARFRRMLEENRLTLVPSDKMGGLRASKGGRSLSLDLSFETFDCHELIIHDMIADPLDDEFLALLGMKLKHILAEGTHRGACVSQQLHAEITHDGLDLGPVVRTARAFFRNLPLIEPGMPALPARRPFIQMPKVHGRSEDALAEILGPSWNRHSGESERDHFLRVSGRLNEMFPYHAGVINFDNIVSAMASAHLQRCPSDPAADLFASRIRSVHKPPIPTVEIRLTDTPDRHLRMTAYNPWEGADEVHFDGHAVDNYGLLWNHRFWTSFLYAAQRGLI